MQELFTIKYKDLAKIKKLPPRDQGHYLPFNTYPHGCPLGGFGAGTIGRSPYGDFNLWHIKVGAHITEEIKACSFHCFQKIGNKTFTNVLSTRPYNDAKLSKFGKPFDPNYGQYAASYPKSRFVFDGKELPAEITCTQYSPILPHNYRETSYPLAIFEHHVRNKTKETIEVSLMLSWANMTGWAFEDQRPGVQDNWFSFIKRNNMHQHSLLKNKNVLGVVMGQNKPATQEMDGQIAIGTLNQKGVTLQEYFYTNGTGDDIYKSFAKDGSLQNQPLVTPLEHQSYGSAVAVKITLAPGETKSIPFFLAWDLPLIHFGQGIDRVKYYTRFFYRAGTNAAALITEAAKNYTTWSQTIDQWHTDIMTQSRVAQKIQDTKTLKKYFTMLINEMYFLSDGGSFWDADTGSFGLLECFDYPFYETLDVRFYGSFPLLKFWPKIELQIMRDFAKTIDTADNRTTRFHFHTDNPDLPIPKKKAERILCIDKRKMCGSCPHDLGSPKENPFEIPAAYTWQNTNYWKDLNTKFILLIYRNYLVSQDLDFLTETWPAVQSAFNYMLKMDTDKDGIPENSGYPDQTYDNWIMHGVSAYCGSLWLATIQTMIQITKKLGQAAEQRKYEQLLAKAAASFDKKLWNGSYYDLCEGNTDIMADQLVGQWYGDILDFPLLPEHKVTSALKKIFKFNFKQTACGQWGIVSGKQPNNKMVEAEQGRDVWVGANFALCSLFLHHGMAQEAGEVISCLSDIIYQKGFFFRTPEGWDTEGHFTATMYMRPNAIWSLEF